MSPSSSRRTEGDLPVRPAGAYGALGGFREEYPGGVLHLFRYLLSINLVAHVVARRGACRARSVRTLVLKSLTSGTSGLTTTMNFAPALTAMSVSSSRRSRRRRVRGRARSPAASTIGSAVDARTAVEIGTSSQPSPPKTIRSHVSRSVAVMYSSGATFRKSSLRTGRS